MPDNAAYVEPAARHPWALGCVTCQREAEAEVARLREALTLVQKLVDLPAEQILDDTERARRIKLVVDTTLHRHAR